MRRIEIDLCNLRKLVVCNVYKFALCPFVSRCVAANLIDNLHCDIFVIDRTVVRGICKRRVLWDDGFWLITLRNFEAKRICSGVIGVDRFAVAVTVRVAVPLRFVELKLNCRAAREGVFLGIRVREKGDRKSRCQGCNDYYGRRRKQYLLQPAVLCFFHNHFLLKVI